MAETFPCICQRNCCVPRRLVLRESPQIGKQSNRRKYESLRRKRQTLSWHPAGRVKFEFDFESTAVKDNHEWRPHPVFITPSIQGQVRGETNEENKQFESGSDAGVYRLAVVVSQMWMGWGYNATCGGRREMRGGERRTCVRDMIYAWEDAMLRSQTINREAALEKRSLGVHDLRERRRPTRQAGVGGEERRDERGHGERRGAAGTGARARRRRGGGHGHYEALRRGGLDSGERDAGAAGEQDGRRAGGECPARGGGGPAPALAGEGGAEARAEQLVLAVQLARALRDAALDEGREAQVGERGRVRSLALRSFRPTRFRCKKGGGGLRLRAAGVSTCDVRARGRHHGSGWTPHSPESPSEGKSRLGNGTNDADGNGSRAACGDTVALASETVRVGGDLNGGYRK
ncbi:hypothetical protein B0H17DRAFT_1184843 [Mycena rosella]|uniref:Uncharacterized protein n=1 Tax=Mycena rosella TaxID=1033263 RepID=A0AAD7CU99_MYCRO|nr:hypothetical protein B0H17DRAFT_1184843 [Mycena rosella]